MLGPENERGGFEPRLIWLALPIMLKIKLSTLNHNSSVCIHIMVLQPTVTSNIFIVALRFWGPHQIDSMWKVWNVDVINKPPIACFIILSQNGVNDYLFLENSVPPHLTPFFLPNLLHLSMFSKLVTTTLPPWRKFSVHIYATKFNFSKTKKLVHQNLLNDFNVLHHICSPRLSSNANV